RRRCRGASPPGRNQPSRRQASPGSTLRRAAPRACPRPRDQSQRCKQVWLAIADLRFRPAEAPGPSAQQHCRSPAARPGGGRTFEARLTASCHVVQTQLKRVLRNLLTVTEPLVSIIVRSFNRVPSLGMLIEALLNQTWSNLEIVVVEQSTEIPPE